MSDLLSETGMYAKERKARPFEVRNIKLHAEKRAYTNILYALDIETVANDLDPDGSVVKKVEARIEGIRLRLESIADVLASERRNLCKDERKKDKWASPSAPGEGWLCPDSPTGICIHDNDPSTMCDHCDYCGLPEERK